MQEDRKGGGRKGGKAEMEIGKKRKNRMSNGKVGKMEQ